MPGLCGVVSDGLDVARSLSAFRRIHALNGLSFSEQVYSAEGCLVASYALSLDGPPREGIGRVEGSDAVLLLEGEVYNVSRHRRESSLTGQPTVVNALLASYLERGSEFVDDLDGEFNIVVYEPAERRVRIFNDHVGSYPMYYCTRGTDFAFGSEKKFLLAAGFGRGDIDPVGLLQPFVHRHNLGDRTFVRSVKRLPPASLLQSENGSVRVHSYGRHLGGRVLRSEASGLLEEWSQQLTDATAKRVQGKARLGISLSGGLDSRAIACSIGRTKRPIWARTMGERDSLEVKYATEIARALGFEHSVEDISEYSLSSAVHRIVWRTEGETQFRDGLSMLTHRQTKENCDHLIGGWLGDVSSGAHIRPFMMVPMARTILVEKIFDWYVEYAQADFRAVFNVDFLQRNLPLVRQAFLDSFSPFTDLPGPEAHEMWDLRNRQARMTVSSMPVDSHLFGKVRPFFDRSYLDFVMSVPQRWRVGQSLYKSLIYSMGPEIRSIPNGNNDFLLRRSPLANIGAFVGSAGYAMLRRFGLRLQIAGRRQGGEAGGPDFAKQTRRDVGLRKIIEDFVDSDSFDVDIFSRPAIMASLDQHYRGERDHSVLIGILATMAVALQYFFYDEISSCPDEAQPRLS